MRTSIWCLAPGCRNQAYAGLVLCDDCWARMPRELRRDLGRARQRAEIARRDLAKSPEWLELARRCIESAAEPAGVGA